MERALNASEAIEAINDPYRYQNDPVRTRPPEEHEAAILAHQARIDEVRNQGVLLAESESTEDRYNYILMPGYENTPRGIQLGCGLGYRTGAPVSA